MNIGEFSVKRKVISWLLVILLVGGGIQGFDAMGKLAVFAGVREFPMRVKCATLAWHTMKSALDDDTNEQVTTE